MIDTIHSYIFKPLRATSRSFQLHQMIVVYGHVFLGIIVLATLPRAIVSQDFCPPGSFGNVPDCMPCAKGTYATYAGQQECNICSRGSYADISGATNCTACPLDFHSYASGGTTFDSTCKPNTVGKMMLHVGVSMSLAEFDANSRTLFIVGLASVFMVNVSMVVIEDVEERRLLESSPETRITAVITAPSATVDSIAASVTQQMIIDAITTALEVPALYATSIKVTHVLVKILTRSQNRLVSLLRDCLCVKTV
jgi:hypothetical protein